MATPPRRRGLIDQWGNTLGPDQIHRLRLPVAQPSFTSPRGPFANYAPTQGLTPEGLAGILQASAVGQSGQYMQLLEDIEEREWHYRTVLTTRKNQVAQLPITVKAAGEAPDQEEHADFLRKWLATGALQSALFHLLDGIAKGFAVMEIAWRTDPTAIWPLRLIWRHQRYFEVDWRDGETIMLRTAGGYDSLSPQKFIVHRHATKSGQVLRGGLGRVAVWAWMYKAFTIQDWAVFARNYGQPVRVGRYDTTSTNEDREVLWRAVANIAGDMAAIIPKSMEVEFVEVGDVSKGSELYEKRARYIDEQLSKLVLGQTATTDAIAGGHAVGQEHRQVQEDYERADAGQLCATLNRQLVPQIIAFNFGPQPEYPVIEIGRPDEVPIAVLAAAVKDLAPVGLRVKASELRDRLGLTPPDADDAAVIGGRAAPPVPAEGAAPGNSGGLPAPPPQLPAKPVLNGLMTLHAQQAPAALEALLSRLSQDAQGALSGLLEVVQVEFQQAQDLPDLARRLAALNLPPDELARVLGRGLALANLVGQAQVIEDMQAGR